MLTGEPRRRRLRRRGARTAGGLLVLLRSETRASAPGHSCTGKTRLSSPVFSQVSAAPTGTRYTGDPRWGFPLSSARIVSEMCKNKGRLFWQGRSYALYCHCSKYICFLKKKKTRWIPLLSGKTHPTLMHWFSSTGGNVDISHLQKNQWNVGVSPIMNFSIISVYCGAKAVSREVKTWTVFKHYSE